MRPCPCRAIASPFPSFPLLLRQRQPFSGRRVMSSFSSASHSSWPQYGPVPLIRCPECPRLEPLKRMTCKTDENGNRGRDFLTCESRPYREGGRLYLSPIAQISLDFLVIPSNLGFRVHVAVFRSCINASISSGSMCTFRGFNGRNQLELLGSSIWGVRLLWRVRPTEEPFR